MSFTAALPMYNVTPDIEACWRALLHEFGRRLRSRGACLDLDLDLDVDSDPNLDLAIAPSGQSDLGSLWRRRDLVLSQTCGYPLTHGLADHVHVIGVPVFDAPGCTGHLYSSAIVVRRDDRASTLAEYRGKIVAYNDETSHSGMNALRHAIAPFAQGGRFFSAAVKTGSHLNAMQAVSDGRADIAAIDCVTLALVRDHAAHLTAPLRVLTYTRQAPGLPFIAARGIAPEILRLIAPALAEAIASNASLANRLRLRDLVSIEPDAYETILDMEREALRLGYPRLA